MTAKPFTWLLAISLFFLVFLIAVPRIWPCELVPDEPPTEEAISEGPKGFSGLYEHIYDFSSSAALARDWCEEALHERKERLAKPLAGKHGWSAVCRITGRETGRAGCLVAAFQPEQ